jgi:hypothetical protein
MKQQSLSHCRPVNLDLENKAIHLDPTNLCLRATVLELPPLIASKREECCFNSIPLIIKRGLKLVLEN